MRPVIDNTSWHEIPITVIDSGVDFDSGDLVAFGFHLGASDIGGSGVADQVAVFTGAGAIGGFTRLTYTPGTDIVLLTGASANTGAYVLTDGVVTVSLDILASNGVIGTTSNDGFRIRTNNIERWNFNTSGAIVPLAATYDLGSPGSDIRRIHTQFIRAGTTTAPYKESASAPVKSVSRPSEYCAMS